MFAGQRCCQHALLALLGLAVLDWLSTPAILANHQQCKLGTGVRTCTLLSPDVPGCLSLCDRWRRHAHCDSRDGGGY